MKSNKALNPLGGNNVMANVLERNVSSIDNMSVRRKMQSMANAQMNGNSTGLAKAAVNLNLSQKASLRSPKPLVRKRTAREFAND